MKLVSRMLPCLLVLLGLAGLAQAQNEAETGELHGTVFDFESQPMPGAAIRVVVNGETREFPTGQDGTYSATLPAGTYNVTLVVRRQPLTESSVEIPAGGDIEGNFDLGSMSDEDKARMVEMLNARGNAEAVRTAFDAGRAALAAGDFAGAIEQFSTAAESDDQHVILANLAQAYSGAGQHAEAADAYRRALVQDPENGVYQQNMGIALGNSGDVDGAVEAISRAAELDPLSAGSAYYNLGIIFINRAQMDQAVNAFRQSIAAAADHAPAYYQLGLALVGTAPAEAVEPLEKFLDLAPDDPNAATAQGLLDFARTQ